MHRRNAIINSLKTVLSGIKKSNGYYNDIVDVGEFATYNITNKSPVIVIRDSQNEVIQEWSGNPNYLDWKLTVDIEIILLDKVNRSNIRTLISDVYKALGTKPTLDDNCIMINLLSDIIKVEQEENIIQGAVITIEIIYRTKKYGEDYV